MIFFVYILIAAVGVGAGVLLTFLLKKHKKALEIIPYIGRTLLFTFLYLKVNDYHPFDEKIAFYFCIALFFVYTTVGLLSDKINCVEKEKSYAPKRISKE